EKLLIVNGFNPADEEITIAIPEEIFEQMGLDRTKPYIVRDMLWREVETGFSANLSFPLRMKPYSSFIFKIK
ncbi:MAG TPA: hypothetical protein VFT90_01960, partial [Chryseosolibacter sp.]|nr:hypothetical protein [Chryseosolibacter sp.]